MPPNINLTIRTRIAALGAAAILATTAWPAIAADQVSVYFSPQDRPGDVVTSVFDHAQRQILAAIYDLTDRRIASSLVNASRRGVGVWVAMDTSEARTRGSQYPMLAQALGNHLVLRSGHGSRYAIMHDKFAVVDGATVLTGSFNWTHAAEDTNWENLVVITDPETAQRYGQEFRMIWSDQWP